MASPSSIDLISRGPTDDHGLFYRSRSWCLNPMLPLREQLRRLLEELDAAAAAPARQEEECAINIYLLVCSIACTVDDYLAWQALDLSSVCARFPLLRRLVQPAEAALNSALGWIRSPGFRSVLRWRNAWNPVVDATCALLVAGPKLRRWERVSRYARSLAAATLPRPLLARRLRIPEAFRCQDLAHPDVFPLVEGFLDLPIAPSAPLIVLGPRTAGAYLAPLVRACLTAAGRSPVSWFTVRPRKGVSPDEEEFLRRRVRLPDTHVILVDDFPNTGGTHRKLLRMLYGMGVPPGRIVILTPRHPHRPDWDLPDERANGLRIITVEPAGLHKAKLLRDLAWVEDTLRGYFRQRGCDIRVREDPRTSAINARLDAQLPDGFHVRLKRVFDVELAREGRSRTVRVLAKSVGWGWMGYHAYLAGTRLDGFVPETIALREGILFSQWLEGAAGQPAPERIGAYVARRVSVLPLDDDPVPHSVDYRWVGWHDMLQMVRGVYGPYCNRFKVPALRRHLARHIGSVRTLVDGQMKLEDWLGAGHEARKADFEQHNFGGPEFDFVDPAWDLAAAVFECDLDETAEAAMLGRYVNDTGDLAIYRRIILFKALYGSIVMRRTADGLSWGGSSEKMQTRERQNRKAREFATIQINRYCAALAGTCRSDPGLRGRYLFMDLDGVFYGTHLGFPHATPLTAAALGLLNLCGVAVVVNTSRHVAHVREFCRAYGIQGGLAESGSVFVDAAGAREVPLLEREAAEQLERCRAVLQATRGVYLDEAYRYSIRASRIADGRRVGLGREESARLLRDRRLPSLCAVEEREYTDILQRDTTKGTGVFQVAKRFGIDLSTAGAIGDSDRDLPMLLACAVRYAPPSSSPAVLGVARFPVPFASAARDFTGHGRPVRISTAYPDDPLEPLLRAAGRSRIEQFARLLFWHSL